MNSCGDDVEKFEFFSFRTTGKKYFYDLKFFSHGQGLFSDISVVGNVRARIFYCNHHLLLDFELPPITIVTPKITYEQQKAGIKKRDVFPEAFGGVPVDNSVDYCG